MMGRECIIKFLNYQKAKMKVDGNKIFIAFVFLNSIKIIKSKSS